VIRCDREDRSGCRASPSGRAGAALPRVRASIRQIADRLGRSPATIKAYLYDPLSGYKKTLGDSPGSKAWNRFFTCLVNGG
jgi:hypothetical protein